MTMAGASGGIGSNNSLIASVPPVEALPTGLEGSALVRALALDPSYQLK